MKLQPKQTFDSGGKSYIVESLLGEGGQGEVYLVSSGGEKKALKIYKDCPSESFLNNLKRNVEKGSPASTFLWPQEIVELDDAAGYIMELRGEEFQSFDAYLSGAVDFKNRDTLLLWCVELCRSFKSLHEKGFSYQDLNDGSFFLNPDTGGLLICDNDNVTADKRSLGILGKMRYMAPEIVRGDVDRATGRAQMPDMHSDRFSLAVILFLALCKGFPFEGERLRQYELVDEKAELELFGKKPLYVYHPTDLSNRPIRGYHKTLLKYYPMLPSYIKAAFEKTFVEGLDDRENGRTTEIEWIRLLNQYRDELLLCPSCGTTYYYGFRERKPFLVCPACKAKTKRFCELQLNRSRIVLEPGKKLFLNHIDKYSSDYNVLVGEVIASRKNPAMWGIRLHLDHPVEIKDSAGTIREIPGDGVIPIVNNLKVRFSPDSVGEMRIVG